MSESAVSTGESDKPTPVEQSEPVAQSRAATPERGKKLAVHIHVAGQTFKPGDTPPPDVAKKITNPKAWA